MSMYQQKAGKWISSSSPLLSNNDILLLSNINTISHNSSPSLLMLMMNSYLIMPPNPCFLSSYTYINISRNRKENSISNTWGCVKNHDISLIACSAIFITKWIMLRKISFFLFIMGGIRQKRRRKITELFPRKEKWMNEVEPWRHKFECMTRIAKQNWKLFLSPFQLQEVKFLVNFRKQQQPHERRE